MESSKPEFGSKRRPARWAGVIVLMLAVGTAIGWAGAVILSPASSGAETETSAYATVIEGDVGSSIRLSAIAEWSIRSASVNGAQGVVTTVNVTPGTEVTPGDLLYSVGLAPVVIGQGRVPSFRDIGLLTKGADVAQLQQFLTDVGIYSGNVDGEAGAATVKAISTWQKEMGAAVTGTMDWSSIVYVDSLPTRIALDPSIVATGKSLSGGEPAVQVLPTAPVFSIPLSESQLAMIPGSSSISIMGESGETWHGSAGEIVRDASGAPTLHVVSSNVSEQVCALECNAIPLTGKTSYAAEVETVPTVRGLTVPTGALTTLQDGTVAVITDSGDEVPVTILAAAKGLSVIEGIEAGARVQIPMKESSTR